MSIARFMFGMSLMITSGAGLVILDSQGIVRYFTTQAMGAEDLRASVDLVHSSMES